MLAIPELIRLGFETTQLCTSETVSGERFWDGDLHSNRIPRCLEFLWIGPSAIS